MNTSDIVQTLKGLASDQNVKKMPRGMLDELAPAIFEATKAGHSLHAIRRSIQEKHNLTTSVPAMAAALRRNGLVPKRQGRTSHNVCYI